MNLAGLARIAGLATLLLSGSFSVAAVDIISVDLADGQNLEIKQFTGSNDTLLLWLPSERGPGDDDQSHADALAKMGHEVWIPEFHKAFFLQPGRASIRKIPLDDVVALIDLAVNSSDAQIVLMSSTRGAQLALIAARQWQLQNPGKKRIQGLLLMHAYLYETSDEAGKTVDYLPIVSTTNLPVYLLDAQFSTTSMRMPLLAESLAKGGSQVFSQVLKGVEGGFHTSDDSSLNDIDLSAKRNFAQTVSRAIRLLSRLDSPEIAVPSDLDATRFSVISRQNMSMIEVAEPARSPALQLPTYGGKEYSLAAQSGKLVLVNFWASWCGPCVKEIPSLHRLKSRIDDPDFEIITVNMGESRQRISEFLRQVPIDFPVLMDLDGSASSDWNVYYYPSNYLVDRQGEVRYVYLGALEWDSRENIGIIQNLLHR